MSPLQVPLLVARYAGKPEIAVKVRDAVRTHQSGQEVVALSVAMARILERVVLGCTILVCSSDHHPRYLQCIVTAYSWAQERVEPPAFGSFVVTILCRASVACD